MLSQSIEIKMKMGKTRYLSIGILCCLAILYKEEDRFQLTFDMVNQCNDLGKNQYW